MLIRTKAIVLKNLAIQEADLIVTYLTEELGLVKAFAKSPRKTGSRFGSSLEPFSFVRVSLFGKEGTNLLRITGSDIIEPFQEIREDLKKVFSLAPVINITERLLPEKEPEKKSFSLLLFTLRHIRDAGPEASVILSLYYMVRFLDLHGFSPKLDHCTGCSRDTATYHISHGSLYCSDCASQYKEHGSVSIKISEGTKRLYHALLQWNIKSILRIKVSPLILDELIQLLQEHIRYHVIQRGSPPLFHLQQLQAFPQV
ncbi:MAG: DNA repair protein RecO [Thermodesulfovibrionales bacterium]